MNLTLRCTLVNINVSTPDVAGVTVVLRNVKKKIKQHLFVCNTHPEAQSFSYYNSFSSKFVYFFSC